MSGTYGYIPLAEDRIRLFKLHFAVSPDAPLECSVLIRDRKPGLGEYEAVSYVWAATDEDTYYPLKVRTSEEGKYNTNRNIWIRPNLAAALRRFRSSHEDRMLWSDAICIDQSSDIEKSQQIPRMEDTYSMATQVLVWLGNETKTSKKAIRFMHNMLDSSVDRDDLVKGHAEEWHCMEALMRMSWFTRRWIVQEIALARKAALFCGDDEISWHDFCDAVGLFSLHYADIKATFLSEEFRYSRQRLGELKALGACRLVEITSNLFRKSEDGTIQRRLVTLENLVSLLTMFDATNPHDIIYAMVPISKDVRTVAQKERSFAPGALPVSTPRHIQEDDPEEIQPPPSKKRKRTSTRSSVQARSNWRHFTKHVIEDNLQHYDGLQDGERPRKCAKRFQGVVEEVLSNMPCHFLVDYQRTFLRVCMDFVAFSILQSKSLDILCKPWVPEELKYSRNLPSWLLSTEACAFRPQGDGTFVRVNADPLVGDGNAVTKRYCAAGNVSRARRCTEEKPGEGWGFGYFDRASEFVDDEHEHRSLFVSGFVLATINDMEDKAVDGTIPNEWFRLAGWNDRSKLPPDHLWRTLVADRQADGTYTGSYYQRTLRDIVQEHTPRNGALNVKKILETPRCDKTSEMLLERILAVVPNRKLFRLHTKSMGQLLGLASAEAKMGDLVCILYGCSVPVVLRQHQTRIGQKDIIHYQFLGDAYVHGMMEGDALEEIGIQPQQFELR